LLASEGELDAGSGGYRNARVPESVRDAINRRLARLSPACMRALVAAATIGRTFDLNVLARAIETNVLDLLDVLDGAVQAQLVATDGGPGRFRFSHALVQETLYQGASPAERSRLHLAVGLALEAETSHELPWAELARHYYLATPLGEPEKILRYSERAGDLAMTQFAWDAATTHYRHALSALTPGNPEHQCALLLALGEAQNRAGSGAGDAPAARTSFVQAFELARTLGDGDSMARAAIGHAGINLVAVFGGARQLELLEEALVALEPADSLLRARLLARLAMDLWNRSTANFERSGALADEAVAAAERLGDPTVLAYALNALHFCCKRPDNLPVRKAVAVRLVAAAERTGDPIAAAWGYLLQMNDNLEAGEVLEAERVMVWLQAFDERVHIPYIAQRVAAYRALLALQAGRYAEAAEQVERAKILWQSTAPRQHACQSFILLRDLGRLDVLTEQVQIPDGLHSWRAAAQVHRMALALERGESTAARADYDALVADGVTNVAFNQHWYSTLATLTDAAVAFGDRDRAAQMYSWMEPYAERQVFDGSLVISHGPVARYLGRLAGLLGRWTEGMHWLDLSLAICEQLGLRPYTARTLLDTAELLAGRDAPGDRAAARTKAERAIEIAESIGMFGLVPRAVAMRDACSQAEIPDLGLTPRERDVLRLIAQGLTDAEVAERLSLSPRTVGSHLTSIYGKLHVQSRTAAARIALEHGLA
jgi:DNA-binding CsgD family transcriptional regulator/tetratricopeptide (TPR) repeat protein